jgi:hypothetical protein
MVIKNRAGANPMDLIDNVKQIQAEKQLRCVIVIHGGTPVL